MGFLLIIVGLTLPLVGSVLVNQMLSTQAKDILFLVSGIIFGLGFVPYIYAIVKKGAKPVIITWLVWATLDSITLTSMFAKNAANWQMMIATGCGILVFILALFYGERGWKRLDVVCLVIGLIGAVAAILADAAWGILGGLVAVMVGAVPTIKSAWKNPKNESALAWGAFTLSCFLAIAALPGWAFAQSAQVVVFTSVELTMMFVLLNG